MQKVLATASLQKSRLFHSINPGLEPGVTQNQAHVQAVFEQAGIGVFHASLDGRFLRANDKYCAMVGYECAELMGLTLLDITHPDHREQSRAGCSRVLAEPFPGHGLETRHIRRDGVPVWVNLTITVIRTAGGEPDYLLAMIEDIQQRKNMEAALMEEQKLCDRLVEHRVAERTSELLAANSQLQAVLYAASHDLKGPLGRISNFSSLLESNYRDRLDSDGLLFVGFIRENAIRLDKLIDDLLTHARVDRETTCLQSVDLLASVQWALRQKFNGLSEIGTAIRLKLPAVRIKADSYCLHQALHNLLENAFKYSAQTPEPVIEIGGTQMDGRFRLWIRDNGIGFDMEYHDRIFEMFRRLHSYAQYTGTGVGLALVKRAMERMGGKVWAESEPGQGATFYLEFELAEEAL